MRLSEIDISSPLTDDQIKTIVFSDAHDNGKSAKYGIVFGNSMVHKERTQTAVELYKSGRIKKVIFTGGTEGVSNQDKSQVAEAIKMRNLAIELGVREEDILIDDKAKNSFENIDNAFMLIGEETISEIIVVTSEFHLKRCRAIINKKYPNIDVITVPARDGFSDSDNWFLSDSTWNSGRSLVTFEAGVLVKYAREGKIEDVEIRGYENLPPTKSSFE